MRQPKTVSDQLRQAVRDSEMSRYQISRLTGIAESILSRFVNSDAGLSLGNFDRLCQALGLRLTSEKPAKQAKRKVTKNG